jgi:hypothetical protein
VAGRGRADGVGWEKIHCQWTVAGTGDGFAESLLVGGEDADALAAAANADVPLLGIGRGLDRGVGEEDVVHGFPLGSVGGDGVPRNKFPERWIKDAPVGEFDSTALRPDLLHGHEFAMADLRSGFQLAVGFEVEPIAFGDG